MNVLGINPGHNGSAALVSDNKLMFYVEEERLSRNKYDGNPFLGIMQIMEDYPLDRIIIGGTGQKESLGTLPWTGEDPFTSLIRKKLNAKNVDVMYAGESHHFGHAALSFYNSGFDKAISIVVDGCGSFTVNKENGLCGFETDTVFVCEYPNKFELLSKKLCYTPQQNSMEYFDGTSEYSVGAPTVKVYEGVTDYLGFGFIEAGKTMGLAPYGKPDENIPQLYINGRGNQNVFMPLYPAGTRINQLLNPYLRQTFDPKEWHRDPEKIPQVSKNLAYAVQKESQELVLEAIKKAIELTGIKKVCISGGYGLNCTANYFFRKSLPSDVQLWCEPISHDGGTSIGLAMIACRNETEASDVYKSKSIYLGKQYDPSTYLNDIDEDEFEIQDIATKDVAKLISDRNIVALFQGRAEAGPRALGNRSILYDPRDPDGKQFVNIVKGREWFRPFAGSMLKEDAKHWFDMAGMEESPFMMYAIDVQSDKAHLIPSIIHVDDTCRIQTVTKEQNEHYYNLISEFKNITGVPIVFNTSFNLAGEPLVETIKDALHTLRSSKMNYLYLPEIGKLLTKKVKS
jgi:carbamoyltransferase